VLALAVSFARTLSLTVCCASPALCVIAVTLARSPLRPAVAPFVPLERGKAVPALPAAASNDPKLFGHFIDCALGR
jgi:hypothetical protein